MPDGFVGVAIFVAFLAGWCTLSVGWFLLISWLNRDQHPEDGPL